MLEMMPELEATLISEMRGVRRSAFGVRRSAGCSRFTTDPKPRAGNPRLFWSLRPDEFETEKKMQRNDIMSVFTCKGGSCPRQHR
ncbi:hypothetical protein EYF80_067073 [Liparis tanakae]|uniref:Uncharacterized protein n=1 Tax=Liparis tanakae TaxID=230148 RepID=A0A4Z2E231_9TELE|nr:hypothetical protein EYF80_067073 [Liparis tanakae]